MSSWTYVLTNFFTMDISLTVFSFLAMVLAVRCDDNIVIGEDSERISYRTPALPETDVFFIETFDNKNEFSEIWVKSEAKKDTRDEALSKYDGEWEVESAQRDALPGDLGLVLKSKAKHAAISANLKKPFIFSEDPFIIQYEVLLQEGQECGGAYLKLLTADKQFTDLRKFHDKTPYVIMFGPDKCGNDHKLHFIFRHKNPKNGSIEEKHCKKPSERIDDYFSDKKPHLYRLAVNPDNTFKVFIDHNLVNSGSLLEDFNPPVNPPAEIDDPNDKKPLDWDDREKIPDLSATKPDDWNEEAPQVIDDPSAKKPEGWLDNEPSNIRDPFAEKPDDWDEDMDGEWEAPLVPNPACEEAPGCGVWKPNTIPNPEYKGKWHPPMIDNPNYQGKWLPRRILNPEYFEDKTPFKMGAISAVGFELWSMSPNILFDNIIITSKVDIADKLASQTFDLKKRLMEMDADTFLNRFVNFTNKHPWLWALYVVILLIPITIIVVFCFGSSKEKDQLASDALRKKTDEPEPDDQDDFLSLGSPSEGHIETVHNAETVDKLEDLGNREDRTDEPVTSTHQSEPELLENNSEKGSSDLEEDFPEKDEEKDTGEQVTNEDTHETTRKRCQRID